MNGPQKYRKKPIVVEAVLFTDEGTNASEILSWAGGGVYYPNGRFYDGTLANQKPAVIAINTLEGEMTAQIGDYIIRGVKGEFYPCKPDIFAATYEQVLDGVEEGLPVPYISRRHPPFAEKPEGYG